MSLTKASYYLINGASVNIKDYGAVGDGTTDDTAAIQAALNAAMSVRAAEASPVGNSQALFIPAGIYKVTSTLFVDGDNFTIYGEGVGVSVIYRNTDYGNTFAVSRPRNTYPTGNALFNVTIKDFTIQSDIIPTSGSHIYAVDNEGLTIENVLFYGAAYKCVTLQGCDRFVLNNLKFYSPFTKIPDANQIYYGFTPTDGSAFIQFVRNGFGSSVYSSYRCSGVVNECNVAIGENVSAFYVAYDVLDADGIWFSNCYAKRSQYANWRIKPSDIYTACTGVRIVNCWSDYALTAGMIFEDPGAASKDHVVADCEFFGRDIMGYGIVVNSPTLTNLQILGNTVRNVLYEGFDLRSFSANVQVSNNTLFLCDQSNTPSIACISVGANQKYFDISNNKAGGNETGTNWSPIGILVKAGTSDYYTITDNNCSGNTSAGVYDLATGVHGYVYGNQPTALSTIASATTLTVSNAGTVFNVTGTTNITSITASTPNRIVVLRFTGAGLTVVKGSNLYLDSNYVTIPLDTLTLISDGTNWFELSRSHG